MKFAAFTLSLVLAAGSALRAEDKPAVLKVGDKAPAFTAKADTGKTWKSSDVVGKKILVVYFFPADMTPGCTKQACGFRDDMKKLQAQGVVVVGVSGDSVRNHQLFKKVHNLNFTLLADQKGKIAKSFGVPLRKGGTIKRQIDGKTESLTRGVTAQRWTYVINRKGEIVFKNTRVKAAEDSKAIMKVVAKLK
jgi:thioredoxin-dependent peroxiredoxin